MKELPDYRDPSVEELDAIITRLALMKTQMDKARKVAKIEAHIEKERKKTAVSYGSALLSTPLLCFALSTIDCDPSSCCRQTREPAGRALNLFPADSWVRVKSFQLVENSTFASVVLVLIIVNSVLLAVDRPTIEEGSTLNVVLVNFDIAFAAFFTWEMVVKVRVVVILVCYRMLLLFA
jgi:hypothetical protein